ncbi:MAG: histidine kinase [Olsenella sp.]|nr:histidine kinase [Olsenella sp.]MCI2184446.1 histidine kinase [Olsenella sp.]MCI2188025.1 histidine kinase [Olsenella sp.]
MCGVRIIATMERIADKCVVLLACLALVVLGGEVDAVRVVALLAAVGASAGFELARGRRLGAAEALCCVACAVFALVPGAWAALPLACYDLPRVRSHWALVLAPCCVAWAWTAGVPAGTAAVLLALVTCSMALSWRCGRAIGLGCRLHALQDDLQDKVIDLREKNRELEDARAYESHAAALAERTRIAREIHDSVGHQLTRLVLEVEALKVMHREDAGVVAELGELSDGLGEALTSMRASVHALEDSAVDVSVELNRLAGQSGIAHVDVDCGLEAAPPAEVSRCLVAVTREALTNAARHAHAAHATVHVTGLPGIWQLRVENDGDVPADVAGLEGRGMGLRGMRERVEGLGGTLLVQSDGRRFSVFASIPRKGQA